MPNPSEPVLKSLPTTGLCALISRKGLTGSSANLAFWKGSQPRPLSQAAPGSIWLCHTAPITVVLFSFPRLLPRFLISRKPGRSQGLWLTGGETEACTPGHSDWPSYHPRLHGPSMPGCQPCFLEASYSCCGVTTPPPGRRDGRETALLQPAVPSVTFSGAGSQLPPSRSPRVQNLWPPATADG